MVAGWALPMTCTECGGDGFHAESCKESLEASPCPHEHLEFLVLDQTGGVGCKDCMLILAHCWMDNHIPESLWNRLAAQDPEANASEQSRDDVCAICEEPILPIAE